MKLYRVVTDVLDRYDPCMMWHNELFEALYYQMGYTSFHISNEKRKEAPGFNTEFDKATDDGKYFFIYPEDAYKNAMDVIVCQTKHKIDFIGAKIQEYEVPFEIATKLIGYGYYNFGDSAEVYVEKKDFPGEYISYEDIFYGARKKLAEESMRKSKEFYSKYEKISDMMFERHLKIVPNMFEHHPVILVKTEFITGRSWDIYMNNNGFFSSRQVFDEQTNRLINEGLFTNLNENDKVKEELVKSLHDSDFTRARSIIKNSKRC